MNRSQKAGGKLLVLIGVLLLFVIAVVGIIVDFATKQNGYIAIISVCIGFLMLAVMLVIDTILKRTQSDKNVYPDNFEGDYGNSDQMFSRFNAADGDGMSDGRGFETGEFIAGFPNDDDFDQNGFEGFDTSDPDSVAQLTPTRKIFGSRKLRAEKDRRNAGQIQDDFDDFQSNDARLAENARFGDARYGVDQFDEQIADNGYFGAPNVDDQFSGGPLVENPIKESAYDAEQENQEQTEFQPVLKLDGPAADAQLPMNPQEMFARRQNAASSNIIEEQAPPVQPGPAAESAVTSTATQYDAAAAAAQAAAEAAAAEAAAAAQAAAQAQQQYMQFMQQAAAAQVAAESEKKDTAPQAGVSQNLESFYSMDEEMLTYRDCVEVWSNDAHPAMQRLLKYVDSIEDKHTQTLFGQEVEYINAMLDRISYFTELQYIDESLDLKKYSFSPLVKETLKRFSPFLMEKRIGLLWKNLDLDVVTDKRWFIFALTQIIFNAVEFTPHGGKIAISAKQSGEYVDLMIDDNGTGISEEDMPYIFVAGYMSDSAPNESGRRTGMGLFIARSVLNKMGGEIFAESNPGKGTRVTMRMPVTVKTKNS